MRERASLKCIHIHIKWELLTSFSTVVQILYIGAIKVNLFPGYFKVLRFTNLYLEKISEFVSDNAIADNYCDKLRILTKATAITLTVGDQHV